MSYQKEAFLKTFQLEGQTYAYYDLQLLAEKIPSAARLPYSLKVLLENVLRHYDGQNVTQKHVDALAMWSGGSQVPTEISFQPARVLMQDFTGVPAVVDLASMRQALVEKGLSPDAINPLNPVDLVIDHSVMVDHYGDNTSFKNNVSAEYERNHERYTFLKWGQSALSNFCVVPPGTGICHQVNLEYLAKGVWSSPVEGRMMAYPDTLVGTDSHTTMVNGLGVLGWGVGGIEAEAAMLGQPISMLIPQVIGFELKGALPEGATATDLVLKITHMLRGYGVVGKFVEFFGDGLNQLPLTDRATIANMSPEFGSTCAIFPIDDETLKYLRFTGRSDHDVALTETYAKKQGLWRDDRWKPTFSDTITLDLATIEPMLAGPKRPQDKVLLSQMSTSVQDIVSKTQNPDIKAPLDDHTSLTHGDVVIAAITSCTNTSNPSVMLGAGLIAKKALEKGLQTKPWVKTSLAPGSQVVTDYLEKAGLQEALDKLGFNLVGYGCTTCIGNSGPLNTDIEKAIQDHDLSVAAVLSGNRNFEGRIHPFVKLSYLASPMLVVLYALAGTTRLDFYSDALGYDQDGNPVTMKDLWPTNQEIAETVAQCVTSEMFVRRYKDVFKGDAFWNSLDISEDTTYQWSEESTYVKCPPFFKDLDLHKNVDIPAIHGARILALLGDSTTTDHISPAGAIKPDSPAGLYLQEQGVPVQNFNSYGSRRGNHEVMMRGTFANIRLQNEMTPDKAGGYTRYIPSGETLSIYEASMKYQLENTPLVIVAGKEYGTGSSRDWAAKGTRLLGIKVVLAESFERIHRSNLVGMGIIPMQFMEGDTRQTLQLTGREVLDFPHLDKEIAPGGAITLSITYEDGMKRTLKTVCRVDTKKEMDYLDAGGILHFVLKKLVKKGS